MNGFFKKHLMAPLLIVLNFTINGQDRATRFHHLSVEDGLSQNMVDCMVQDHHGFLWFGTWNGLCRYDGYTFELFNSEVSNAHSLKNNFIYSLLEDPQHHLWIGTREGLEMYDYDQDRVLTADQFAGESGNWLMTDIHSLAMLNDSVLLLGTGHGLAAFGMDDKGMLTRIPEKPSIRERVSAILVDKKHNRWIGTEHGLVRISEKGETVRFRFDPADDRSLSADGIQSLFESKDGTIWIGTDVGLNRFRVDGFDRFYHFPEDPQSLVHNVVMDLDENDAGELLIATLGGYSVFSPKTSTFKNYVNQHEQSQSLSNDFVNCVLRDHDGNIWLGTERGGVNFYHTHQNRIQHFGCYSEAISGLSHQTVNSVFEDDRYLWIGTAGGGLNRYDRSADQFKYYRASSSDSGGISSDFITSIGRDRQGRLWVGTWGHGLNVLEHEGTSRESFRHYEVASYPGLTSDFISAFTQDEQGRMWIATLGALVVFDSKTEVFEPMMDDGQMITEAGCLLFDHQHQLWVGTRNGLYGLRFNQDGVRYRLFKNVSGSEASISGNYIISMQEDAQGRLWLGTYGKGLNRMYESGDSVWFESFSVAQGLSNTVIYGIEEDASGDLWLSTDNGLSRFDPQTEEFRNYYTSDGLQNSQYYWSASFRNEAGKLYFGGMNGLDAFYPEWIEENPVTAEMVITDVRLLNESVRPGEVYNGKEVLRSSLFDADHLELSYREKYLGIAFSALHFLEPAAIHYSYILEGFEEQWNEVSSDRRYASYTNLKPGHYTFRVKASGPGVATLERRLSIDIPPPFTATAWFKMLLILLIMLLLLGYVRWRTYALKQQKLILERQVAERTERINRQKEALTRQALQLQSSNQDLEEKQLYIENQNAKLECQNREIAGQRDELLHLNKKLNRVSQLKISFFTNISHEFRTPLTLIIGPLERLLAQGNKLGAEVRQPLTLMSRNAQRLQHLVDQLMDFRKLEKGRMHLKVQKVQVSRFCQDIFEAFRPLAELRRICFQYKQNTVSDEVWMDPRSIENILYNLLSNALKYTPEGGSVCLIVADTEEPAEDSGGQISMRVEDSGIGISTENLPLIFKRFYRIESEEAFQVGGTGIGLALTEELIKAHHGAIFVESELGEGSSFEIRFPSQRLAYEACELVEEDHRETSLHKQIELLKNELLSAQEEPLSESPVQKGTSGAAEILVVEDNPDLRKFLTQQLGEYFHVLQAGDGVEGLDMARNNNPDLVISDVMMPKMNGLEMCRQLKDDLQTSHIPVILLTAKNTVENQLEGLRTGADDYLAKPFNLDILRAKVDNLIASRKQLQRLFRESPTAQPVDVAPNVRDQRFLEQAMHAVTENMHLSSFGPKELVKELGVSRSLLHKKLTVLAGQSAADFINQIRMKRACDLLKATEMNISEVAYAVGYNDPKYFSRLFSRYYGRSPKDYLKEILV